VYNNDYKLPDELPSNKTQPGGQSDASLGGGGYSEFNFEDKKGQEQIGLHAQKNYKVVVPDIEQREVGATSNRPRPGPPMRRAGPAA